MPPDSLVAPSPPHPAIEPLEGSVDTPAPPSPAPPCANCGTPAGDHFCPRCGQEQHDYHRSIGSIFGEALDALAGWDAKIPASIGLLLARPGRLTNEFLRGRRARYLRPLRVYLLLSLAFFVALRYEAARSRSRMMKVRDVPAAAPTPQRPAGRRPSALEDAAEGFREGLRAREQGAGVIDTTRLGEFLKRRPPAEQRGLAAWFKYTFKTRILEIGRLPPEQRDRVLREAVVGKLANLAICLVPLFALLLRALWFRARLFYAEHFVVALHTHAFAFGALTLVILLAEARRGAAQLPVPWLAAALRGTLMAAVLALLAWLPVYPFVALRRVYGGSRRVTLAKYVVLGALYAVALMIGLAVTIFAAILLG
jgi:hypothetical protein